MANADRVTGLKPVKHISGAAWNGQTVKMYKAAGTTLTNDLMPGDPVIMAGSGDTAGVPSITRATAGDGNAICGVVVSIVADPDNLGETYIDGADAGYVNVCCDPTVVYEGQADASLAVTDIGQNTNLVATDQYGDPDTGQSGFEVDATVATTSTHQLKIIGFVQREDNAAGADVKVLVLINNHQFGNVVTGV